MNIPLEDTFADVLGKALRGLAMTRAQLARASGLDPGRLDGLLRGETDRTALLAVAPALKLDPAALADLAGTRWHPGVIELPGLLQFNTPYPAAGAERMRVNSYLAWNGGDAVAFDAGADVAGMLAELRSRRLSLRLVLLTHAHPDHIAALPELLAAAGHPPVWVSAREPVHGASCFEAGRRFSAGALEIGTRLTGGHSPGGTTYVVHGLPRPVAIVGDALFCCSQGGVAAADYVGALERNRSQILSLPDETVVCPGHGPVTTVGWERLHNPFHAGMADAPADSGKVAK